MLYVDPSIQYKTDTLQTATTDQLVLMLFEAALRAARDCQTAVREGQWTDIARHGRMVQEVCGYLAETVDMAHPHAVRMKDLYLFCWRTVIAAQIERRPELLDPVITVLTDLAVGLRRYVRGNSEPPPRPVQGGATQEVASIDFSG